MLFRFPRIDFPKTRQRFAHEKAKEAGDKELIAKLLNNIGLPHGKLGDHRNALDSYEESGRIAENLDMEHLLALTCTNRALILRKGRDWLCRPTPHSRAAAIPCGGGYNQNQAIRFAH